MATESIGQPVRRVYGEQVSLTTTAAHVGFRPGYKEVLIYCPSAFRMSICPKLAAVFKYTAATTTYTDYSAYATDRLQADATRVPLDAMAAADELYLGTTAPTRGFYFDLGDSLNANAASLDWEYCSAITAGAATFTDVAGDSDGTLTGTETLSQDGLYAFTLVTDATIKKGVVTNLGSRSLYWYRFGPSATLSATTDIYNIYPAADTVNYGHFRGGVEYQFNLNVSEDGAFEFDHTGTATLDITWVRH
jgi:hypothetical protein